MIKNIITIALIFTSSLSMAQDDAAKSAWIKSPVKVDGNAKEWIQPLRYYDPGIKLFFAFSNDDKNLYLCFQTPDDMNQMKIMRAGMKITLSAKGKHKVSINFPLVQKSEPAQPKDENSEQQNFDRKNIRNTFLAQNTMMEVKGFATRNGMIPINDSSGINAAINWDENDKFTYEISIPLKELFGNDYTPGDISNITLDAEVNALSRSKRSGNGGGDDGFTGVGGGGRMGGGGRGSGGMHRDRNANGGENNSEMTSADRAAMYEKGKLKQKFILAQNSNAK